MRKHGPKVITTCYQQVTANIQNTWAVFFLGSIGVALAQILLLNLIDLSQSLSLSFYIA